MASSFPPFPQKNNNNNKQNVHSAHIHLEINIRFKSRMKRDMQTHTHTRKKKIDNLLHSCSLPIVSFYFSFWHTFSVQFLLRSLSAISPILQPMQREFHLFGCFWHAAKPNVFHGNDNSAPLHTYCNMNSFQKEEIEEQAKKITNSAQMAANCKNVAKMEFSVALKQLWLRIRTFYRLFDDKSFSVGGGGLSLTLVW